MAREGGGGGGAFGWTILGVIIGVAGTLAVQTFMGTHRASEAEQPPTSAAVAVVTSPSPPPPPPVHAASSASSTMAADPNASGHEDVEDDAAAAGMTSRSHAGDADGQSSSPADKMPPY